MDGMRRYFFLLLGVVYGAFVLAMAGLRSPPSADSGGGGGMVPLMTKLFSMIAGDVSAEDFQDTPDAALTWWVYHTVLLCRRGVAFISIHASAWERSGHWA